MSGRPFTPPPSGAGGGATEPQDGPSTAKASGYTPSLFDFVHAFRPRNFVWKIDIPSTFLEAASVDSAKQIGSGASFEASVRVLPEGPKTVSTTTIFPTHRVTNTYPAPQRPKHVVFKVARVAFDQAGYPLPGYKAALQSALTELHVLLDETLSKHPNVVKLLGLAWGTNPFSIEQRLPALVVECADHGTLRSVMDKGTLSSVEKRKFCFDVASGLHALHRAGLVHGDIKAENVLVFSRDNGRVCKLGDFGFSVVEESEIHTVWLGGTRPWQAPEVQQRVLVSEARQTDVYSFGLLVWCVAIDGQDPFRKFLVSDDPSRHWDEEIEEFKLQDGVIGASQTLTWFQIDLMKKMQTHSSNALVTNLVQQMRNVEPSQAMEILKTACSVLIAKDPFLSVADAVFAKCLTKDPAHRDLAAVIEILRSTENTDTVIDPAKEGAKAVRRTTTITNTSSEVRHFRKTPIKIPEFKASQLSTSKIAQTAKPRGLSETLTGPTISNRSGMPQLSETTQQSWSSRGFKHKWLSWQAMRDQPPALQRVLFKNYETLESSEDDGPGLLLLSSFLINGYGHVVDIQRGLQALRRSADLGNHTSRAYLYRVHVACGVTEVQGVDLQQYLEPCALSGSRAAMADVSAVKSRDQMEKLHRLYTDAYAGVGANWYSTENMLHGLLQLDWIKDDYLLSQAANIDNVTQYRVNKRGDTLLHFVAACGRHKPLKALIEQYGFDVNSRNDAGDTPLICACRAGHGGNAILLIRNYKADVSLASKNGETALHWLISFEDPSVAPLAQDLIVRGAVVDAMTTERISHSAVRINIDMDFQMPGTPLAWAVHENKPVAVEVLLQHGASPYYNNDTNSLGPINWAVFFHHDECLGIIIRALEARNKAQSEAKGEKADDRHAVVYGPLLARAIHAADRFSMILRHGVRYRERLHATLALLREKTKLINAAPNFGGFNQTLLYYTVSEAHDEVVEYMLEHDWHKSEINTPCGPLLRTPVLEAVRWARMPLVEKLIQHGGDIHWRGANPYSPEKENYSALHILAHEGFNDDTDDIVSRMLAYGLDIEGRGQSSSRIDNDVENGVHTLRLQEDSDVETPLSCALRSNAFNLCDSLQRFGASPTSLSLSAGLYQVASPMTILGHLIIANARYSLPRLRYLLRTPVSCPHHEEDMPTSHVDRLFIVQPEHGLSALHIAAMANRGVQTTFGAPVDREDFDMDTNAEIMRELLSYFGEAQHLNAKCKLEGKTALMLAIEETNDSAIGLLLAAGADNPESD